MYNEHLLERCTQLYGEDIGDKLSLAMLQIYQKDFCVTTGFDAHQISISRSCIVRGKLFRLSEDYSSLIMPDGTERTIESLNYTDIVPFIPKRSTRSHSHRHCFIDDPLTTKFDFASLI